MAVGVPEDPGHPFHGGGHALDRDLRQISAEKLTEEVLSSRDGCGGGRSPTSDADCKVTFSPVNMKYRTVSVWPGDAAWKLTVSVRSNGLARSSTVVTNGGTVPSLSVTSIRPRAW